MAETEKNLKVEALRCAAGVHCAHVAASKTELKPEDVVGLAKNIFEFLKDGR